MLTTEEIKRNKISLKKLLINNFLMKIPQIFMKMAECKANIKEEIVQTILLMAKNLIHKKVEI
jgi:hypothetical protein